MQSVKATQLVRSYHSLGRLAQTLARVRASTPAVAFSRGADFLGPFIVRRRHYFRDPDRASGLAAARTSVNSGVYTSRPGTRAFVVASRKTAPASDRNGSNWDHLKDLDRSFTNHAEAYKSKTNAELLRASLVFWLCSIELLVRNNQKLMKLGRQLLGQQLFQKLMEATFYGHFVAGVDAEEVKPALQRNLKYGVNSILYYSMEEDIRKQKDGAGQGQSPSTAPSSDKKYDRNVDKFLLSVDVVASATAGSGGGCIAIKPSALAAPEVWLKLADTVVRRNTLFDAAFGTDSEMVLQKIEMKQFVAALLPVCSAGDQWADVFRQLGSSHREWIHRYHFNDVLLGKWDDLPSSIRGVFPVLDESTRTETKKLMRRANSIAEHARRMGIAVMVDAEQSYFQPAINRVLGLELMKTFNKDTAVVYNTYQTYLQGMCTHIMSNMAFAEHENFRFGSRIVRGAYLQQERDHALISGTKDPTNTSYEATTAAYEHAISTVLLEAARRPGHVHVMAATHNEGSVAFVLNKLQHFNVPRTAVSFGQLYGMSDHISFPLGQAGCRVYKSVPYGPVELVFSYLGRRALENLSVIGKTSKERELLRQELATRLRTYLHNVFKLPYAQQQSR